jgi:hypothetical protein
LLGSDLEEPEDTEESSEHATFDLSILVATDTDGGDADDDDEDEFSGWPRELMNRGGAVVVTLQDAFRWEMGQIIAWNDCAPHLMVSAIRTYSSYLDYEETRRLLQVLDEAARPELDLDQEIEALEEKCAAKEMAENKLLSLMDKMGVAEVRPVTGQSQLAQSNIAQLKMQLCLRSIKHWQTLGFVKTSGTKEELIATLATIDAEKSPPRNRFPIDLEEGGEASGAEDDSFIERDEPDDH